MKPPALCTLLCTLLVGPAVGLSQAATPPRPPNIAVIVADDLGYADVRFNPLHSKEITTSHLDALAKQSIICRQGYVTGNACSPTRAGLMTGRYQQRLRLYTGGEVGSGLPMSEKISALPWGISSGAEAIDFVEIIRPILSGKCFKCHAPDAEARKADLRLTDEGDRPLQSKIPARTPSIPYEGP